MKVVESQRQTMHFVDVHRENDRTLPDLARVVRAGHITVSLVKYVVKAPNQGKCT